MDTQTLRELRALQDFLDYKGQEWTGRYYYHAYYENNLKVVRGKRKKDDRLVFMMPDNTEHSELDWWVLYAVNALGMADSDSVTRYLDSEKKRHPELLFSLSDPVTNVTDPRRVRRRLQVLSKLGFLTRFVYVTNTDVDVDEALNVWKSEQQEEEERNRQEKHSDNAVSLDDEYMDECSGDEISYVTYSSLEYNKKIAKNKALHDAKEFSELGMIHASHETFKKYFGSGARLVTLYAVEDETFHWLKERFGVGIAAYKGNPIVRLSYAKIGSGAIGYVASHLSTLPAFHSFVSGKIASKFNGNFIVPVEMEFKVPTGDGGSFSYHCGVFKSYYYQGEGRLLPQHEWKNLLDTIYCIKNYIGIRGVTKEHSDGFVIVVVNDMMDLLRFMDALKKKITPAESNRIFFTGGGIMDSPVGMDRMIGFRMDENEEPGYCLYPVRLPVV